MGDTLSCTATETTSDLASYDPTFNFDASKQVCEAKPKAPAFAFQETDALFTPSTPATFKSNDYSALVCKGSYRNLDDYLAEMKQASRVSALGPYVASLPSSGEEKIPTNPHVKIVPGQNYPLTKVWKGLPQELRVYLDNMGLKGSLDLAIAYQGADGGSSGTWHIMQMNSMNPGTGGQSAPSAPPPQGTPSGPAATPVKGAPTGATPPSSPTPPTEPTFNISIGSAAVGVGMVGLMVAFDQAVIKKKFPDLPRQAMLPMNLGTFYGLNYLLFKGGMIQAPSWGHVWKPMTNQLPFLASLGILISIGMDRIGAATGVKQLQFGNLGNELGAPLLTLGAYYTIVSSKTLSPLAGGLINGGRFSFAAPAGGAGVLGGVGQALGVAGIFFIGNMAVGGVKEFLFWYLPRGESEDVQKEMRLQSYLWDRQQREMWPDGFIGDLGNGLLGSLGYGLLLGLCDLSDDAEKGRQMEIDGWREQMIDGSKNFGTWARGQLVNMIADSINLQTGEVDWSLVEQKFQKFIDDSTLIDNKGKQETVANRTIFANAFQTLDYTGHAAHDAQEIKDLLGNDLSLPYSSRERLKEITRMDLLKNLREAKPRVERLAREIGVVKTVDGQEVMVPPELLTPEQQKRVQEELLPLNTQVMFTGAALEHLNAKK